MKGQLVYNWFMRTTRSNIRSRMRFTVSTMLSRGSQTTRRVCMVGVVREPNTFDKGIYLKAYQFVRYILCSRGIGPSG